MNTAVHHTVFITLKTFSAIGGIEKFNRCLGMALVQQEQAAVWSVYDTQTDGAYVPSQHFLGFGGRKAAAIGHALLRLRRMRTLVLGHVHLGILARIASWLSPQTQRVMVAHGVEVWQLTGHHRKALMACQQVWAVSQYTADRLIAQGIPEARIRVLYNTLDPWFGRQAASWETWQASLPRPLGSQLLLTVARLQPTEQRKGYHRLLALMPQLRQRWPQLQYVLAGPAHPQVVQQLQAEMSRLGLPADSVVLTGPLQNPELAALYAHAQVYAMPSSKEGFGIVYIEAAWSGCRVVAEQAGGAPEALLHGELGTLVPPGDDAVLLQALHEALEAGPLTQVEKQAMQQKVSEHFGFAVFCQRLQQYLHPTTTTPTPQPKARPA